ncbi:ANTAR domain-containing protein [Streptomyces monticola]|uniref:ANTAR domain-containing protein n=1 Tax=Streptomyces monticola TaxID=2666263 RepID=A0ABW2JDD9_9ACTN
MAESADSGTEQVGSCGRGAAADAHRLPGLRIFSRTVGDRTVVSVRGELELATDHRLQRALRTVPVGSDGGVDLDLHGVEFCICSAVNIWFSTRQQVLDAPRTAGADDTSPHEAHAVGGDGTERAAAHLDMSAEALRLELEQLRRAMQSRGTIDLARGIIMAAFTVSPETAWQVLVATSQNTNTKLHHVAQQLVDTSTGGTPLPKDMQDQLSAAIEQLAAAEGSSQPTAAAP